MVLELLKENKISQQERRSDWVSLPPSAPPDQRCQTAAWRVGQQAARQSLKPGLDEAIRAQVIDHSTHYRISGRRWLAKNCRVAWH